MGRGDFFFFFIYIIFCKIFVFTIEYISCICCCYCIMLETLEKESLFSHSTFAFFCVSFWIQKKRFNSEPVVNCSSFAFEIKTIMNTSVEMIKLQNQQAKSQLNMMWGLFSYFYAIIFQTEGFATCFFLNYIFLWTGNLNALILNLHICIWKVKNKEISFFTNNIIANCNNYLEFNLHLHSSVLYRAFIWCFCMNVQQDKIPGRIKFC